MPKTPRRRRFRFSLRTLLILCAAICVLLGSGIFEARQYSERKHRAKELIISLGGKIQAAGYERNSSPGASWLALRLGLGEPHESLWKVDLRGTAVSSKQLRQVGQCAWIRSLDLSNTRIGDSEVGDIARITQLRELKLANTKVTDVGLLKLKSLDRLYLLDVSDTAVTYDGLADLEKTFPTANLREQLALSRLQKRKLVHSSSHYAGHLIALGLNPPPLVPTASYINLEQSNRPAITKHDVRDLRQLASATQLRIQGVRIPNGRLAFISDLPNLETVGIYDTKVPVVSDEDLITLSRLPRLSRLELYGNNLTDDGIAHLSDAHQIEQLSIYGQQLTPKMLVHLQNLQGLRRLDLNFWHRPMSTKTNEESSREAIREAREQMKHLSTIKNLRELSVTGSLMVDEVVATFVELKTLRTLKLDGRFSTRVVAQKLRNSLPGCLVQQPTMD